MKQATRKKVLGGGLCVMSQSTFTQNWGGGARKESVSIHVVSLAATTLKGARGKRGG